VAAQRAARVPSREEERRTVDDDIAALHAIGQASLATQGLDEAAFLPFSASFAVLVPRYVAWLHRAKPAARRGSRGEADLARGARGAGRRRAAGPGRSHRRRRWRSAVWS
jgi:hypothetical protein